MNNRIEKIRNTLKENDFNMTKVLNCTGLGMQKYSDIINDKEVILTENELWCLEFRLFNRENRRLLY